MQTLKTQTLKHCPIAEDTLPTAAPKLPARLELAGSAWVLLGGVRHNSLRTTCMNSRQARGELTLLMYFTLTPDARRRPDTNADKRARWR